MKKKSGFTPIAIGIEQAIVLVPEFEKVVRKLEQQVTLRGQSKSTLQIYIRRIALFVVHFGKLPEHIDLEEINEYLAALARDSRSPSRSSFKHIVYWLRYYYRLLGMNKNAIALPSLKKDTKLPVILNHQELKELFSAPTLLKQRVVLILIYSAGLRGQEVINLKKTSITKDVNLHSLRHSYATHLLEQGLNIVTLKELLGHADIITTMIYLHVAKCPLINQLSSSFKGKFPDRLKRALRKQNELTIFNDAVRQAYKSPWVVHCQPSLAGAHHVVKYLGQYTHRVAVTNQRILNIAGGKVTFIAKDYRDRAVKKPVTLYGVEFLRRFTMHILPRRFVKIRRFGIYNHTVKRKLKLQFVLKEKPGIDPVIKRHLPPETNVQRFERLTGINPCKCPVCKTGRLLKIRELPRIRSPGWSLLKQPQA